MVASYITGRLGNQLFQYAFAKAIKHAQGSTEPLVFDFSSVYRAGSPEDGFEDSLQYFNVEDYKTDSGLIRKYSNCIQKLIYLLFKIFASFGMKRISRESWYAFFRKNGLIFSRQSTDASQYNYPIYSEYVTKKSGKVICNGYFEIPSLFEHIKPILIKEFTPKLPPLEHNAGLYDIINGTNSVCVSVRRGDFVDEKHRSSFYVCDKDYFVSAIHLAQELVREPVFVFFSDDIDWVKKNISVEAPSFYESGNDPVWEKLRLMYNCKHFIISNSTFSWWAQYLSRNTKDKVVISPDHWFNVHTGFPSPLIADGFVKIPCEYH